MRYYEKYSCNCRIIKNNLTEKEALELENTTIITYKNVGMCCCNLDNGGRNGGSAIGKRNSQYGVSPKDRMDNDTYNIWRAKQRARKNGKSNPNYGNHVLHQKYSENPELALEKQSRPGQQNGRARPISMYDSNKNLVKQFTYIYDCVDYLIKSNIAKSKSRNAVYFGIYCANKNKRKYRGYYFCY